MAMDDLEFVQQCAKGDKLAWDAFVDKYSRLIYSYIYSVLKIKGIVLAKDSVNDLFQEVFVLLANDNFRKLKTFKAKNGCSLASWLRQVTINLAIDYIRRLKPVVSIDKEDEDDFSLKEVLVADSPAAADALMQAEKLESLKDCIQSLERDDRYFLRMHIDRGLTLDELKDYFKVSRGAIDMRRSRIIDRLRECFKRKGFKLDL